MGTTPAPQSSDITTTDEVRVSSLPSVGRFLFFMSFSPFPSLELF